MSKIVIIKTMVGDAATKIGASYITLDVNTITGFFTVQNSGWGGIFSSSTIENAVTDYKRALDDEINKRLGTYMKKKEDDANDTKTT